MQKLMILTVRLFHSPSNRPHRKSGWGRGNPRCEAMGMSLVVLLLILSGCGGSYYRFSKPGVTQQQMRQDGFECKQASRQSFVVGSGGMLVGGDEANKEIWRECLQARGYTVTEVSEDEREREVQWLQDEYKWLIAEETAINKAATELNNDRIDTPQRRNLLVAHQRDFSNLNVA